MKKEVFVVGELKVAPQFKTQVEDILATLRKNTRSETGCIFYQFFEAEGKPGTFATIEHWSDADAEEKHWQTAHIAEANRLLSPILKGEMRLSRYLRTRDEAGCI